MTTSRARWLGEADLEWAMIDSTIVRTHQHAAGASKQKEERIPGPGRSRGGLSTKAHAAVEAHGLPAHRAVFSKLMQFGRVGTRYDKLLANFMGLVKLVAIVIWLK